MDPSSYPFSNADSFGITPTPSVRHQLGDHHYRDLIYSARTRFPNLRFLYEELDRHTPGSRAANRGRVAVVDPENGGTWKIGPIFDSAVLMDQYLERRNDVVVNQ